MFDSSSSRLAANALGLSPGGQLTVMNPDGYLTVVTDPEPPSAASRTGSSRSTEDEVALSAARASCTLTT